MAQEQGGVCRVRFARQGRRGDEGLQSGLHRLRQMCESLPVRGHHPRKQPRLYRPSEVQALPQMRERMSHGSDRARKHGAAVAGTETRLCGPIGGFLCGSRTSSGICRIRIAGCFCRTCDRNFGACLRAGRLWTCGTSLRTGRLPASPEPAESAAAPASGAVSASGAHGANVDRPAAVADETVVSSASVPDAKS